MDGVFYIDLNDKLSTDGESNCLRSRLNLAEHSAALDDRDSQDLALKKQIEILEVNMEQVVENSSF